MNNNKILITGVLGFIGYHIAKKLVDEGHNVVGIDNINSYYNVKQKYAKLPLLGIEEDSIWPNILYKSKKYKKFEFAKIDITNCFKISNLKQFVILPHKQVFNTV